MRSMEQESGSSVLMEMQGMSAMLSSSPVALLMIVAILPPRAALGLAIRTPPRRGLIWPDWSGEWQEEWEDLVHQWERFLTAAQFDRSRDEVGDAAKELGLKMKDAFDRLKKAAD